MKVKLTRMKNGQNLRTDEVIGHTDDLPRVGKRFMMVSKGLVLGTRIVETSEVVEVSDGLGVSIATTETGSVYTILEIKEKGEK